MKKIFFSIIFSDAVQYMIGSIVFIFGLAYYIVFNRKTLWQHMYELATRE